MAMQRAVVLSAPLRTAIGTFGGSLKDVPASELGAVGDTLAALKLAFAPDGTITAGNAPGAALTTRLIHSMRRDGLKRGIVTLCIGGGQGVALALETIA